MEWNAYPIFMASSRSGGQCKPRWAGTWVCDRISTLGIFVWDAVMNWKDEIVKLVYVKQALATIDESGLWPHHLPNMGANQESISQTEKALGFKIDSEYSDFLQLADGWNGFYQ